MSTQVTEIGNEDVVTRPPTGTEVWCPNGDGNRFLEQDDPWPLACPVCSEPFVTEKPPTYTVPTEKVRLPEVGRIVHILLAPTIVRPAIVMGRGANEKGEADGRLFVTVFKDDRDPSPAGLSTGIGVVRYGTHLGGWTWPPQQKKPDMFDAPISD